MNQKPVALKTLVVVMQSALLLALCLSGCSASTATATQTPKTLRRGDVTVFPSPIKNVGGGWLSALAAGPDGNLWFAEDYKSGGAKIARFTMSGQLAEYPMPDAGIIMDMLAGPDGNVWFDGLTIDRKGFVGRITPDGQIAEFLLRPEETPYSMTVGPDGNIWFVNYRLLTVNGGDATVYIGRVTPSGAITEFTTPRCPMDSPVGSPHRTYGIAVGPDSNLWFDMSSNVSSECVLDPEVIEEVTSKGAFSQVVSLDNSYLPRGLTQGPNGTMWFIESSKYHKIACIGCLSQVYIPSEFPMPKPTQDVQGLVTGPDGTVWFTGEDPEGAPPSDRYVGQITVSGAITTYSLQENLNPGNPVLGPDKALWFFNIEDHAGIQLVRFQILG